MKRPNTSDIQFNTPFIRQRADPFLCRHEDGTYYFTASVPEYDRIILRSADTVMGLQTAKEHVIWYRHESGEQSLHIWAPEIHYLNGCWYIYYAAGERENKWKIRPYVLQCTGPDPVNDKWNELGRVQASKEDLFTFQDFSLDATVFQHEKEYYMVWAEKTGTGKKISQLYLSKMENPWKLSGEHILLSTPDYEWERRGFWVNEGPAVLKHGGRIYLTYSASDTGRNYCMGMLILNESGDVMDPHAWKKCRKPVLVTDETKHIYGPGHNSFVKAEDNVTDYCIYHGREYGEIDGNPLYDPNRHTMIMKVRWNEEGEPEFSFGV